MQLSFSFKIIFANINKKKGEINFELSELEKEKRVLSRVNLNENKITKLNEKKLKLLNSYKINLLNLIKMYLNKIITLKNFLILYNLLKIYLMNNIKAQKIINPKQTGSREHGQDISQEEDKIKGAIQVIQQQNFWKSQIKYTHFHLNLIFIKLQ